MTQPPANGPALLHALIQFVNGNYQSERVLVYCLGGKPDDNPRHWLVELPEWALPRLAVLWELYSLFAARNRSGFLFPWLQTYHSELGMEPASLIRSHPEHGNEILELARRFKP
jgi:hypothetical protein